MRLTSKGQITIPIDIRERLGLHPGDVLDEVIPAADFVRAPLPWAAAFLAGKCFQEYRRRGGAKRSPLPGFFIGAHAAVGGLRLLTRDAARYRTYFPKVDVVAP